MQDPKPITERIDRPIEPLFMKEDDIGVLVRSACLADSVANLVFCGWNRIQLERSTTEPEYYRLTAQRKPYEAPLDGRY